MANNTPAYVAGAASLGPEDPSGVIDVSIWLKPHDRAALDALVQELYDPSSPRYQQWLSSADIAARFAPTAAEAQVIRNFFQSHQLSVVSVGPDNFYVRARGTVAQVQAAFRVQLNEYQVGPRRLRANAADPYIDQAPAAALAIAVSGLDSGSADHPVAFRPAAPAAASAGPVTLASAATAADSSFFQPVCFPGRKTEKYTTGGTYPEATYAGNAYYSTSPGCGYSPDNIYRAYGLDALHAEGHRGAGQTIVIIDWCGSLTIQSDANAFAAKFGLPPLTDANFQVLNVPAPSTCAGVDSEINLDVEWAHAIAPEAHIDLVVPPSSALQDIDSAWLYAVNEHLGNVISGSYGTLESDVTSAELQTENLIAELSAATGIASNFSSGDYGNYLSYYGVQTVSLPADLPYATGIGGVSLALKHDSSIDFQTGWETYESELAVGGQIISPPNFGQASFVNGSGGGTSAVFAKPFFQRSLAGTGRHVPDISWLADPFTGVAMLISEPDEVPSQIWTVIGGTSLACPMFSALWAIANEESGKPLGQAAPYLYSMPAQAIMDIKPLTSRTNVRAVIQPSSSVTNQYDPAATMGVTEPQFGDRFFSAIWDYPGEEDTPIGISFGADYYLKVTEGWDDVTGLGTPNAKAFADFFGAGGHQGLEGSR